MKEFKVGSEPSPAVVTIPYDARRRLLEKGPQAPSDFELVALVIGAAGDDASVLSQARRFLETASGVRDLARASFTKLIRKDRIEAESAAAIVAAFELGRRALCTHVEDGGVFHSSAEVFAHFRDQLSHLQREVF